MFWELSFLLRTATVSLTSRAGAATAAATVTAATESTSHASATSSSWMGLVPIAIMTLALLFMASQVLGIGPSTSSSTASHHKNVTPVSSTKESPSTVTVPLSSIQPQSKMTMHDESNIAVPTNETLTAAQTTLPISTMTSTTSATKSATPRFRRVVATTPFPRTKYCIFIDDDPAEENGNNTDNSSLVTEEEIPNSRFQCSCAAGFLPRGILKTFGSAEAIMRLGSGQCYHKQT
jgi:hypothetical protein